jgi:hypothetical protein
MKRLFITFWVLLITAISASFGFAQSEPAPLKRQIFLMYVIQAKPGMVAAFENLFTNDVIPALKKGGGAGCIVLKSAILGDSNTYQIALPIESMADIDIPNPLVKALGQKGLATLMAKLDLLIENSKVFMFHGRPDLSIMPQPDYAIKLAAILTTTAAPGRARDYEKSIKEWLALVKKTNAKGVLTGRVGLGGNPNEYRSYYLFDSFADIERFNSAIAKVASEAQLSSDPGLTTNSNNSGWVTMSYVPELSFEPVANKSPAK